MSARGDERYKAALWRANRFYDLHTDPKHLCDRGTSCLGRRLLRLTKAEYLSKFTRKDEREAS